MNLGVVWEQVVRELSAGTLSPQQRAWMRVTRPIGLLDGTALLAAPSDFAKDAIERALREPITDALSRRLGRAVSLAVKVDPVGTPAAATPSAGRRAAGPEPPAARGQRRHGVRASRARAPRRPGVGSLVEQTLVMAPIRAADTSNTGKPSGGADADGQDNDNDEVDEEGDALATVHEIWPTFTGQPRRRRAAVHRARAAADVQDPAEREVHVRHVRHRRVQPVRARGRGRRRRGAGPRVQPAVHLGRVRARQDPPAARGRPLRPAAVPRHARAVRVDRGVHQRLHQLAARRPQGRVPAPLPRHRHPAGRRHPVPGGQGRNPGGVLPHLQHAAQREQADRRVAPTGRRSGWRPWRTGCARGSSGASSPTSSRRSWRPASPSCARRPRRTGSPRRPRCWSSSRPASSTTSASSRAR